MNARFWLLTHNQTESYYSTCLYKFVHAWTRLKGNPEVKFWFRKYLTPSFTELIWEYIDLTLKTMQLRFKGSVYKIGQDYSYSDLISMWTILKGLNEVRKYMVYTKISQGTLNGPLCPAKDFHDDSSRNKCNFLTNGSRTPASSSGAKAMQILSSWTAASYSLTWEKLLSNHIIWKE